MNCEGSKLKSNVLVLVLKGGASVDESAGSVLGSLDSVGDLEPDVVFTGLVEFFSDASLAEIVEIIVQFNVNLIYLILNYF